MTKAQKALLGKCFNLDPFVDIMSFLILHISPKMTFLKDTSTDYQVFTRPRTDNEIIVNNELRRYESRLPIRGETQDQVVNSTRKRKLAAIAMSPTMSNTSHLILSFTSYRQS